jgi:hypothetical protein
MTKSCALLNFDRLYVTSKDAIWKKGGKEIWVSIMTISHSTMNYRKVMTKLNENNVTFVISSSDNKSVSHWIMFDYFFHHKAALIYRIIVNALLE